MRTYVFDDGIGSNWGREKATVSGKGATETRFPPEVTDATRQTMTEEVNKRLEVRDLSGTPSDPATWRSSPANAWRGSFMVWRRLAHPAHRPHDICGRFNPGATVSRSAKVRGR